MCPLPFCTKRWLCVHVEDFSLQTSSVPWEGGQHTEHSTKLGLTTSWRTSYLSKLKKSISKQVKHKSYDISYYIYNSQYYMYQYYLIFIWLKNVLNIFFLIQRLKRFWTLNSPHLIFNNLFLIDRFLMWKTKCKNIFSNNWKLLKKCLFQKQNTFKLWKSKAWLKQQDFWLLVRCQLFLSLSVETIFHWHMNHQSHQMKTYFSNSSHGNSSMQNMIQAM